MCHVHLSRSKDRDDDSPRMSSHGTKHRQKGSAFDSDSGGSSRDLLQSQGIPRQDSLPLVVPVTPPSRPQSPRSLRSLTSSSLTFPSSPKSLMSLLGHLCADEHISWDVWSSGFLDGGSSSSCSSGGRRSSHKVVIDGSLLFHEDQLVVHFIVMSSLGPHGSACRIRRTVQFCFERVGERVVTYSELACGIGRTRLIVLTCGVCAWRML